MVHGAPGDDRRCGGSGAFERGQKRKIGGRELEGAVEVTEHEMFEQRRRGKELLEGERVWAVFDGDAARTHAVEREEAEAREANTIQEGPDGDRDTDKIEREVEGFKLGEHAKDMVEGEEDGLHERLVLLAHTGISLPSDGEAAYGVMEVSPGEESLAAALGAVREGRTPREAFLYEDVRVEDMFCDASEPVADAGDLCEMAWVRLQMLEDGIEGFCGQLHTGAGGRSRRQGRGPGWGGKEGTSSRQSEDGGWWRGRWRGDQRTIHSRALYRNDGGEIAESEADGLPSQTGIFGSVTTTRPPCTRPQTSGWSPIALAATGCQVATKHPAMSRPSWQSHSRANTAIHLPSHLTASAGP